MNLIKTTDNGLMKFKNLDAVAGNTLALMLEVEHTKMMRTIKKVIKSEGNRKKDTATSGVIFSAIFKEWEYLDSMNRKRKTFIMNEDALYLVIANSQGKKAHELKVLFKSEFNKMKMEREARQELKLIHPTYTDQVKVLSEMLKEEGSKHYSRIYTTIQRQINKAATLNPTPTGANKGQYRETLTEDQLADIQWFETFTAGLIAYHARKGHSGREIRKRIKDGMNNYFLNSKDERKRSA